MYGLGRYCRLKRDNEIRSRMGWGILWIETRLTRPNLVWAGVILLIETRQRDPISYGVGRDSHLKRDNEIQSCMVWGILLIETRLTRPNLVWGGERFSFETRQRDPISYGVGVNRIFKRDNETQSRMGWGDIVD